MRSRDNIRMDEPHASSDKTRPKGVSRAGNQRLNGSAHKPPIVQMWIKGTCDLSSCNGEWNTRVCIGDCETSESGEEINTTAPRMALTAVIHGFYAIEEPAWVTVYTDLEYVEHVLQSGSKWLRQGKPRANADLIAQLLRECDRHYGVAPEKVSTLEVMRELRKGTLKPVPSDQWV